MAAFLADDDLDPQAASTARRQSVPEPLYSDEQMAAVHENLRRHGTIDFSANQPLVSVNPFGFDASMAGLDPTFSAMNIPVPDMSIDAQYQAAMGYAPLSAPSAGFQSAMAMNQMNSFLSNSPSMQLSLDTDLSGMPTMGDPFATHHFGTPILTSPMVAGFGVPMFGSSDVPMGADSGSELAGNLPTGHQKRPVETPVRVKTEKVKPNFREPPG
jgi:hypothetical protein